MNIIQIFYHCLSLNIDILGAILAQWIKLQSGPKCCGSCAQGEGKFFSSPNPLERTKSNQSTGVYK